MLKLQTEKDASTNYDACISTSDSATDLSRDHLLDLSLGKSLELGTSTDELAIEVDVGDGSLTIEVFEVGLDGIWGVSAVWR